MTKKKKFDPVKQVKSLSRVSVRTIPGRPIQSKKEKLIDRLTERESRDFLE